MPYAFHWLTLPDLQGSVKRGKGNSENINQSKMPCSLKYFKSLTIHPPIHCSLYHVLLTPEDLVK